MIERLYDQNKNQITNKIQLGLSAVMFFSPFVQLSLNNKDLDLTQEERVFVKGYVKLGYINIFLLVVALVFGTMSYFVDYLFVSWIAMISVFVLIGTIVIEIFGVITEITLIGSGKRIFQYKEITNDKTNIIFGFLPLYNVFLRYKIHDFDTPYRRVKESLLWRIGFVILSLLTGSVWIGSFVLILITFRIVSLVSGIDVVSDEIKKKLNTIFYKNPEEIWGYVLGLLSFVRQKIHLHSQLDSETKIDVYTCIEKEKEKYQILYTFQIDKKLYVQYGLLFLVIFWGIYKIIGVLNPWIYYLPLIMIGLRYGIMYLKWKHLPYLPLIKEFVDLAFKVFWMLKMSIQKGKSFYLSKKQKGSPL